MKHLIKSVKLAWLLMAFILPNNANAAGEFKEDENTEGAAYDSAYNQGASSDGSTNSITLFARLLAATKDPEKLVQALRSIGTSAPPAVLRAGAAIILDGHRANPTTATVESSRLLDAFQTINRTEDDELVRTLFLGVAEKTPFVTLSSFLALGLQSLRSLISPVLASTQEMRFIDMQRTNPRNPLYLLWVKIIRASPDTLRYVIIPTIVSECMTIDSVKFPMIVDFIEKLQIAPSMDTNEEVMDVFYQIILYSPCTLLHRLQDTALEIGRQIDEANRTRPQLSSADPRYAEERRMLLGHPLPAAERLDLHSLASSYTIVDHETVVCAGAGAAPIDESYYNVRLSPSNTKTPDAIAKAITQAIASVRERAKDNSDIFFSADHEIAIAAAKASIQETDPDLDYRPINIIKVALKFMHARSRYRLAISSINLERIINYENPQTIFLDFASINAKKFSKMRTDDAEEFSTLLAENIVVLATKTHPDLAILRLKNIPLGACLDISSESLIRLVLDDNPNLFSLEIVSAPKLTEVSMINTALEPANLESLETIVIANITATGTIAEASCSTGTEA